MRILPPVAAAVAAPMAAPMRTAAMMVKTKLPDGSLYLSGLLAA